MRTHRWFGALLGVAVTVLVSIPGAAQSDSDLPTVAVMDLTGMILGEDAANSAALGKAVSVMLITEMQGRPGLRMVERQELRKLIEEQALAVSGMVDDDTAIEIGQLLGAGYMVWGGATLVGPTLRLDLRMVDVETGEVEPVLKLSDPPEELLDMLVRAGDAFTESLELVTPAEREALEEIPAMATIEFSRGVDYEDKGDVEAAIERYEAALEIHPTHRDARRALDRLRSAGEDR